MWSGLGLGMMRILILNFSSFLFLKDFKNKIEKLFFYSRKKETKIQLESEEKIPFLFKIQNRKRRNCSFVLLQIQLRWLGNHDFVATSL